jgi:hypothetical protein
VLVRARRVPDGEVAMRGWGDVVMMILDAADDVYGFSSCRTMMPRSFSV